MYINMDGLRISLADITTYEVCEDDEGLLLEVTIGTQVWKIRDNVEQTSKKLDLFYGTRLDTEKWQ